MALANSNYVHLSGRIWSYWLELIRLVGIDQHCQQNWSETVGNGRDLAKATSGGVYRAN